MCLVHLENVRIILKMCLVHLENVRMIWKVSWQSKKCPDNLQNVLNYHYKCTLWSTFGPFLCLRSCKHTFYRHLSRIRKLTQFMRFIWKVFATKSCCPESFCFFWFCPGDKLNSECPCCPTSCVALVLNWFVTVHLNLLLELISRCGVLGPIPRIHGPLSTLFLSCYNYFLQVLLSLSHDHFWADRRGWRTW